MKRIDQNSFDAQGDCPICWGNNLEYQSPEIDWYDVAYDWECNDCHSQWTERYTLEFYSQNVLYDWKKEMRTDNEKREREPI